MEMEARDRDDVNRRKAWWGVFLIAIGIVFLLDQLELVNLPGLGHLWPAILVMFGLFRLAVPRRRRDFSTGVMFVLLGLWFFANEGAWWGLHYGNSWPILLVIFGFTSVLRAVRREPRRGCVGGPDAT